MDGLILVTLFAFCGGLNHCGDKERSAPGGQRPDRSSSFSLSIDGYNLELIFGASGEYEC